MTIEEKRERIRTYCDGTDTEHCTACPLSDEPFCDAADKVTEREVERLYQKLFGDVAQLDVVNEDADTIIKIKSNRKVDSIEIRFQEDK